MKVTLSIVALVILSVWILWCFGAWKLIKTAVLISRIQPFERDLGNAPTILILGDSTGYGTGARSGNDSIAGRIGAEFRDYSIVNRSANGRTVGDFARVAHNVRGRYALILLQIGGNDILQKRDVHLVEKELRSAISSLETHTNHLVMISTGNIGGAAAFSERDAAVYEQITRIYRAMFIRVAVDTSLNYVDLFLEPEVDIISQQPEVYLAFDGLHPSSEGYALWYRKLQPTLQAALQIP